MTTRIVLWAVPRAVGTAFERVFVERNDTFVAHEVFMPCHYYSASRASSRYDGEVEARPEFDYRNIREKLDRSDTQPVLFVKEIAFHMQGIEDDDYWSTFRHTFILRDPRVSVPSLYKLMPDLTFDEAGFAAMSRWFRLATERFGQQPVVVNGDKFRTQPAAVLKAFCGQVAIPFQDTTTFTTTRSIPEWSRWRTWHEEALTSTHIFQPPLRSSDIDLPDHVEDIIERSMPYYDELNRHAIDV